MKKLNKKGFTIVELVIVIAVIAILASVMIPTFSGIIKKAQDSAAEQAATSKFHAAIVYAENADCNGWYIVDEEAGYYFVIEDGKLEAASEAEFAALTKSDSVAAAEAALTVGSTAYIPVSAVEGLTDAAATEVAGVYCIYTCVEADPVTP